MNAPVPDSHKPSPTPPKSGRWRKVRFTLQAIEVRLRFVAILVAVGLAFSYWDTLRNYWDKWTRPPVAATAAADGIEYFCPMHPQVVRDTLTPSGEIPKCPICAMPLSKREKGDAPELPPGVLSRVEMSPERVRMAGVATVKVGYQPLVREIRTVGYVAYDEAKLSEVVARVGGYVEELYIDETFEIVEKGDPLAKIYSPELYQAAQELAALRGSNNLDELVAAARQKLRLLGVSETEIDEIWQTGKTDARIVIRSPQSGHVINKSIIAGSRIETGQTLFELAGLSTVWIEAEVHEKDIGLLRPGQKAIATIAAYPGKKFTGHLGLIHPHLERSTRTVRVRFEVDNPDHLLMPGMYATVTLNTPIGQTEPFRSRIAARKEGPPQLADAKELIAWQKTCPVTGLELGSMGVPVSVSLANKTVYLCCDGCLDDVKESPQTYISKLAPPPTGEVLTVPRSAVIDTGKRKIVYVESQPGVFQGMEVELGPLVDGVYPVISGLSPDDEVAAAGAFLIDAETRLNPSSSSAYFGASGGPDANAEESGM